MQSRPDTQQKLLEAVRTTFPGASISIEDCMAYTWFDVVGGDTCLLTLGHDHKHGTVSAYLPDDHVAYSSDAIARFSDVSDLTPWLLTAVKTGTVRGSMAT